MRVFLQWSNLIGICRTGPQPELLPDYWIWVKTQFVAAVSIIALLTLWGFGSSDARGEMLPAKSKPLDSAVAKPQVGPLTLEEPAQPLEPKQPQTEAGRERLQALTLFAAGRMLERRQDYAGALRNYQRALRYDPEALTVARSIVPLAIRLKRYSEAVRYALKAAELEDADPLLLRRLGVYVTEQGDWARAVNLYEKALALRKNQKDTAADILLRMEMGRLYHLDEKYKKAAESFARVMYALDHPKEYKLDDDMKKVLLDSGGTTYILFGASFLLADKPEKAAAAFRKSDKLAPDKGLLAYNLAQVFARSGKPEKALAELQIALGENLADEGTGPFDLLAEVLKKLGKEKELVGRLEKLHAARPDNIPLGYALAEQYRNANRLKEAEPLYVALMKKGPTLTGYRSLVDIYRKTKQPDKLLAVLADAAGKMGSLDPLGEQGAALIKDTALVHALIENVRKQIKATASPEKQGEKKPQYDRLLAVALLAMDAKQFDAAGEFFELAAKAKPDAAAELFLTWGVGLLMADKYAESARVFQKGLDEKALPEDNPSFFYYLAGALELAGQTDKALATSRKAAEIDPQSARFLGRVGWVLYHAKRYPEAANAYAELIDKFDANHDSDDVRQIVREARLVLSNMCVIDDKSGDAQEWLEQVLDEFPDDVSALNDLGYLWAEENRNLRRAHEMIQKAVAEEPENGAYRDSLGWVLYRLGRHDEAVAELQKAASDKQPDAVILDHLGDALLKVKQPKKAEDAWRRAAEAFRKASEPKKALEMDRKIKGRTRDEGRGTQESPVGQPPVVPNP